LTGGKRKLDGQENESTTIFLAYTFGPIRWPKKKHLVDGKNRKGGIES
jgi:hypothetical protein